jgi:DNA-binding PucR family transcriptional regulator
VTRTSKGAAGGADIKLALGCLVAELGTSFIDVLVAPKGIDVSISGVCLTVPAEPIAVGRGDLVLAAGTRATGRRAQAMVASAAESGAVAVAFKVPPGEAPQELLDTATRSGVALVAVDPEVMWTQLYTFIRSAMATVGTAPSATGHGAIGDLFALANAIAAMVGGPVTIEDLHSNVLAYSTLEGDIDEPRRKAILGRRVPAVNQEVLKAAGVFKALWSTTDVIRVEDVGLPDPMRTRLVIGIRAGEEPLGSIWVQEGDSPFDAAAEEALRQGARIAALHLVHDRHRDDLDRRQRSELARRLLTGNAPRATLGTRLALKGEAYTVLAFDLDVDDPAEAAVRRERSLDHVRIYCDAFRHESLEAILDDVVYVILGLRMRDHAGAYRLAEHVTSHGDQRAAGGVTVGIGSVVEHLHDIPRSRGEADTVLRVLRSRPDGAQIASIEDVRPQAFLLGLRDAVAADPGLEAGLLAPLLAQNGGRQSTYAETLQAYLSHFGDLPRAAASIGVHPNTFRYRLKRACEIGGFDLGDPQVRLALEFELYLHSLA